MTLWSDSFRDGDAIPAELSFARVDATLHVALAPNRAPHLARWDAPEGTRSFVGVCHDFDAPSVPDDVNHPDREVPASLARVAFFHWVLVDLPPAVVSIAAGEYSDQVVPEGKPGPEVRHGARHGLDDCTAWFAQDHGMAGEYFGCDGPCPPWNDALIHPGRFAVHALGVERLPIGGRFTGAQVRAAMQGHVLARATVTGRCTLNPRPVGFVRPAA